MKGSYVLVLHLPEDMKLTVGKLGDSQFPSGYCLYFGSALNSLEGRLRRHLTPGKRLHWHIDFLTAVSPIVQVWWTADDQRRECSWTQRAMESTNITVPVPRFGASDCRACPAHLVHAPDWEEIQNVQGRLMLDTADGGLLVGSGPIPDFQKLPKISAP